MRKKHITLFVALLCQVAALMATPQVRANIDSTSIFLGDQTDLHLQVVQEPGEMVQMPVYGENLIDGIEIVDRTIIDTTILKDGRWQLNQYLTLTSFKDSLFYIKPIPFVVGGETLYSEALSLNVVQPFEVDSAMAITPIKDIYRAPIWWWGIIRWILLALLLTAIGTGAYLAWKKWGYLLAGKEKAEETATEPLRPADEVALEKLDRIREEKIWQEGREKEYQTQLTDVVREYIARRYDVSSTEKTSDETLRAMQPILKDQKELFQMLRKMLQLADLVKFAKWQATPDENEMGLQSAYRFVEETREERKEETTEENGL